MGLTPPYDICGTTGGRARRRAESGGDPARRQWVPPRRARNGAAPGARRDRRLGRCSSKQIISGPIDTGPSPPTTPRSSGAPCRLLRAADAGSRGGETEGLGPVQAGLPLLPLWTARDSGGLLLWEGRYSGVPGRLRWRTRGVQR